MRLRGTTATTNFPLLDYRSDLAAYHKLQQVRFPPRHRSVRQLCCLTMDWCPQFQQGPLDVMSHVTLAQVRLFVSWLAGAAAFSRHQA